VHGWGLVEAKTASTDRLNSNGMSSEIEFPQPAKVSILQTPACIKGWPSLLHNLSRGKPVRLCWPKMAKIPLDRASA